LTRRREGAARAVASGLILIAFGVLFLLDRQGIVDARHLLQTAVVMAARNVVPILLLVAGAAAVREGLRARSKPLPVSGGAEEKP
jgi:hypothetical protein